MEVLIFIEIRGHEERARRASIFFQREVDSSIDIDFSLEEDGGLNFRAEKVILRMTFGHLVQRVRSERAKERKIHYGGRDKRGRGGEKEREEAIKSETETWGSRQSRKDL